MKLKNKFKIGLFFLFGLVLVVGFGIWNNFDNKNDFFSIIVLPDTQRYSYSGSDYFCQQTEWIVRNIKKLNINFVSHLGDMVQSGMDVENEWILAANCMAKLDGIVPYGISPGNHDADRVDDPIGLYSKFNSVFGTEKFVGNSWYVGSYKGNQNSYQEINVSDDQKWLFLNLEVDPTDDDLDWARKVLSNNIDKRVVLVTHAYLRDDDAERSKEPHFRKGGNSGQGIWDKLIYDNCNIFLTLSGHFHNALGEARRVSKNSCGKDVVQIMSDYQSRENGGSGLLRIYSVYPYKSEIRVSTFSPVLGKYESDPNSNFTFSI